MPYQAAQQTYSNTQARNQAAANAMMNQGTALINQGNATTGTVGSVLGGALGNPAVTNGIGNVATAVGNGLTSGWNALTGGGQTVSNVGSAAPSLSSSDVANLYSDTGYGSTAADTAAAAAAADTANTGSNLWDTVSNWFSDENLKKDIQPADNDIESMMEKLTGKKFKYKPGTLPDDGGQEHIGVMAQDAEKAGLNTLDTPYGKMIKDDGQMKGAVLAALGNLHSRVANLEK